MKWCRSNVLRVASSGTNKLGLRGIATSRVLLSQLDPSDPLEARFNRVKYPGKLFKERMNQDWVLGQTPLYTAPAATQVGFTKRWAFGIVALGAYVGYIFTGIVDLSTPAIVAGFAALSLPIPISQYYLGPYVTRIFRVYRRGEPQTYENLIKNETLMIEKIGMFGRSTYGVPIEISQTYRVNKRFGWVNWAYINDNGAAVPLYVSDHIGGVKMDRLWGIIEKNSKVKNGRDFLLHDPHGEPSD